MMERVGYPHHRLCISSIMIRNSTREVMAMMTVKGPTVQGSEVAELLPCRKALEFAIDAGFMVLIVEGDSVNATRCIASGSNI